jgi:hypothetical protein
MSPLLALFPPRLRPNTHDFIRLTQTKTLASMSAIVMTRITSATQLLRALQARTRMPTPPKLPRRLVSLLLPHLRLRLPPPPLEVTCRPSLVLVRSFCIIRIVLLQTDTCCRIVGGITAPPVTAGGKGFVTNGSDFVNLAAALGRSCDVQHNGCADKVCSTRTSCVVVSPDQMDNFNRQTRVEDSRLGSATRRTASVKMPPIKIRSFIVPCIHYLSSFSISGYNMNG